MRVKFDAILDKERESDNWAGIGVPNGVASLDENWKVPISQIPGGGWSATWWSISWDINDQTDLQLQFDSMNLQKVTDNWNTTTNQIEVLGIQTNSTKITCPDPTWEVAMTLNYSSNFDLYFFKNYWAYNDVNAYAYKIVNSQKIFSTNFIATDWNQFDDWGGDKSYSVSITLPALPVWADGYRVFINNDWSDYNWNYFYDVVWTLNLTYWTGSDPETFEILPTGTWWDQTTYAEPKYVYTNDNIINGKTSLNDDVTLKSDKSKMDWYDVFHFWSDNDKMVRNNVGVYMTDAAWWTITQYWIFNWYFYWNGYSLTNIQQNSIPALATTATPTFAGLSLTWGGRYGAWTQNPATLSYVQSRDENLYTNWTGLMGNIWNIWTYPTFDATEVAVWLGSFRWTWNGSWSWYWDIQIEKMPVDINRSYRLSSWVKCGNTDGSNFDPNNKQYFWVACLDIDWNNIGAENSTKVVGSTDTTLAVDLNPWDTTITLTDATGWYNSTSAASRNLVWYGYTNSYWYVYPNYTYTRNMTWAYSNNAANWTWNAGGITGNVITLRTPWAWPRVVAGTAVRNWPFSSTYKYIWFSGITIPNTWTKYTWYIFPANGTWVDNTNQFRAGTAYVQAIYLINYNWTLATNYVRYSWIEFTSTTSYNIEAASTSTPWVITTGAQNIAWDKWFTATVSALGWFYSTLWLWNASSGNNSKFIPWDSGAQITRNVANASTALTVQQANASSTWNIQDWKNDTAVVASINRVWWITLWAWTTASAPIQLNSGTLKSSPTNGALEWNWTDLFITV